MKTYEATEQAYKNGYEKGKADALKWIPVTERLPEYHKEVLTRSKMGTSGHHYSMAKLWMIDDELGWVFDDGFEPQDIAEITHWMPLPEPPKEVSHTF